MADFVMDPVILDLLAEQTRMFEGFQGFVIEFKAFFNLLYGKHAATPFSRQQTFLTEPSGAAAQLPGWESIESISIEVRCQCFNALFAPEIATAHDELSIGRSTS